MKEQIVSLELVFGNKTNLCNGYKTNKTMNIADFVINNGFGNYSVIKYIATVLLSDGNTKLIDINNKCIKFIGLKRGHAHE